MDRARARETIKPDKKPASKQYLHTSRYQYTFHAVVISFIAICVLGSYVAFNPDSLLQQWLMGFSGDTASADIHPGDHINTPHQLHSSATDTNTAHNSTSLPGSFVFYSRKDMNQDTPRTLYDAVNSQIAKTALVAEPDETSPDKEKTLSITGRVQDSAAEPIAGMVVKASLKRLLTQPRETSITGQAQLTAVTDEGGFFQFTSVSNAEFELTTDEDVNYEATRTIIRAGTGSVVLVLDSKLSTDLYLYGNVSDTSGALVTGARVTPVGVRTDHLNYTNFSGHFDIQLHKINPNDVTAIRFLKEGYKEKTVSLDTAITVSVTAHEVNVQLVPIQDTSSVSGIVTGSGNNLIHGAVVQLYSASQGSSYQAVSDINGRFSIPAVETATDYRLWVHSAKNYKEQVRENLDVTLSGLQLSVILDPLNITSLTGQMVNLSGQPIANFSLWLRSAHLSTNDYLLVISDQQGRYHVDNLPESDISFSTLSLPDMSVGGITLGSGPNNNVPLRLDVGNNFTEGRVINANGDPVSGARTSLSWSFNDGAISSRSLRKTVTGANGHFTFSQLGPGLHTLIIEAAGYRTARIEYQVGVNSGAIEVKLANS